MEKITEFFEITAYCGVIKLLKCPLDRIERSRTKDMIVKEKVVTIFDGYMRAVQGSKKLENTDVHLVGVGAMYLASKYEDIYPLHSKVVSEKISHGAFSQK